MRRRGVRLRAGVGVEAVFVGPDRAPGEEGGLKGAEGGVRAALDGAGRDAEEERDLVHLEVEEVVQRDEPALAAASLTSARSSSSRWSTASSAERGTTARQQGEAVVAGQPSHVLAVTPSATCGTRFWRGKELMGPAFLTVWVDKRTFLPLRTDVRDGAGALLERAETTSVEYDVAIPPAVFTFTAPPGAPVFTFSGGSGADVKRILAGAQGGPPPAKQPKQGPAEPAAGEGAPKRP